MVRIHSDSPRDMPEPDAKQMVQGIFEHIAEALKEYLKK